jgi:hypothetical protein
MLERILFRLNAFSFGAMNRDVLGSMYQYFRPRIERRRLGEYYTPGLWLIHLRSPSCSALTQGRRESLA